MNNTEYINNIHKKIKFKKIKNDIYTSSLGIVIIGLVFILNINTKYEYSYLNDFDDIQIYEWENIEELSSIDILTYLIDEDDEYNYLELFNNNQDFLESIEIKENI